MQDLVQIVNLSVILPKHKANYKGNDTDVSHYWKHPLSCIALPKIVAMHNTFLWLNNSMNIFRPVTEPAVHIS